MAGLQVIRFRYGPNLWEKLAYNGGIMANLRKNRLLYFMLPLFILAELFALVRLMYKVRPTAIHAHWIVPQGIVMTLAAMTVRAKPRLICTIHGSDLSALQGSVWRLMRRWVASHSDQITTVSEELKSKLVSEGCASARIAVIPMGADLRGLFVPGCSMPGNAAILFVGRLVPGKGTDLLIRSMPEVISKHPDATLLIAGGGPERDNLDNLVRQLNLTQHVTFAGPVAHDELASHYRDAALLAVPSREEGFGLVVVEALGCGCPVAASDLPSLRTLLGGGKYGLLFPVGAIDKLSVAICEILSNESASRLMAQQGRSNMLDRYDWHEISRRYAALIEPPTAIETV
ncbi:MAG: glycoside hydrolase [Betaproteobacteria bacterium]|nr:MAG: glycoside hydrolase [Betaproteobacteria bacterium]